jgi:hypothetical protein
MVEGHVPKGVEVQVLSSASLSEKNPRKLGDFVFYPVANGLALEHLGSSWILEGL